MLKLKSRRGLPGIMLHRDSDGSLPGTFASATDDSTKSTYSTTAAATATMTDIATMLTMTGSEKIEATADAAAAHNSSSSFSSPAPSSFVARAVVDELGEGLIPTTTMALAEAQAQDEAEAAARAEAEAEAEAAGMLSFLIVDDSGPNRKIVARVLTRQGHRVEEAMDGADCLRVVAEAEAAGRSFDVILMDDSMPNMRGTEATAALRSRGYAGMIIGVTGNTLKSDVDHFLSHGADSVLAKPLDVLALQQCVSGRLSPKSDSDITTTSDEDAVGGHVSKHSSPKSNRANSPHVDMQPSDYAAAPTSMSNLRSFNITPTQRISSSAT
jgi:CheY-like chemotaxis protein